MKTLIVYQSKKGTTKKYAEEIAKRVKRTYGNVTVKSVEETSPADIGECDLLFLGSRTVGKYIFGQKPDQQWMDFANKLPTVAGKKTVLFTTYDIATGKMFQHMKQPLLPKGYKVIGSMKSSSGNIDYFSASVLRYAMDCHQFTQERSIQKLAEVV